MSKHNIKVELDVCTFSDKCSGPSISTPQYLTASIQGDKESNEALAPQKPLERPRERNDCFGRFNFQLWQFYKLSLVWSRNGSTCKNFGLFNETFGDENVQNICNNVFRWRTTVGPIFFACGRNLDDNPLLHFFALQWFNSPAGPVS